jgi:virulence factor Mce-like protein
VRRLALILCLVAAAPAAVIATSATAGDTRTYKVELDNAFGLVTDSDVKVGGVIAGSIKDLDINEKKRALATIELKREMAPEFHKDARCHTRPQSLIAEYFVDCQPGTSPEKLPDGGLIPVKQTGTTVQPDLVNNILREPYRDRLRLIINEFGTGLAGRPRDLNRAIQQGVPALRDTRKVLDLLATQNKIIRDLNVDSDRIIGALARNRKDVSRFVTEARQTSEASAERRTDISASFNKLPSFLAELRPTMHSLGQVAEDQTPALRDLQRSARQLERLTRTIGPFSDASVPSLDTLGDAAKIGRRAMVDGKTSIRNLGRTAPHVFPVSDDIGKLASDLDDRGRAVERDTRSPGGQGYTGFETLLNYVYYQAGAINSFDAFGHALRLSVFSLFGSGCEMYSTKYAKDANGNPHNCVSWLGPNQPGLTQDVCIKKDAEDHTIQNFCPVPPFTAEQGAHLTASSRSKTEETAKKVTKPVTDQLSGGGGGGSSGSGPQLVPDLPGPLDDILGLGKRLRLPEVPDLGGGSNRATTNDLLDFLFGA